jgi:DNA-binding NarL/FixJ family response regulator
MSQKTRVFLVSDTLLVCNMLASLLDDEPDMEVVGSATTVEDALDKDWDFDVILLSASLPDDGALSLTENVTAEDPDIKIIVLGMTHAKSQILQYIEAGADGYVLKDHSVDDLLKGVRMAQDDKAIVSPKVASAMMDRLTEWARLFSEVDAVIDEPANLTPREREILELIGEGFSNQEIADHLVVEVGTVKNHVHSIHQKLGLDSRQKAAAYLALIKDKYIVK